MQYHRELSVKAFRLLCLQWEVDKISALFLQRAVASSGPLALCEAISTAHRDRVDEGGARLCWCKRAFCVGGSWFG